MTTDERKEILTFIHDHGRLPGDLGIAEIAELTPFLDFATGTLDDRWRLNSLGELEIGYPETA